MPIINTVNQQPSVLNSFYLGTLANDFDPYTLIRDTIIKPLYAPLIPTAPVSIEIDGKPADADKITSIILSCCDDRVDAASEDCMKEIFKQTLAHYDSSLPLQDVYAVQAAKKLNMYLPSDRVIYPATDVIDAAKQFISGQLTADGWFATFSFYARISSFGYYFANDAAWQEFKTWFANQISIIVGFLDADTVKLCNDLQAINLDGLTESFVIRDDSSQNNQPYSFARLFVTYLMMYEQTVKQNNQPAYTAGHMPFSFAENFCPNTVIIINVEKHAHAHPNDIKKEWELIKTSLRMKPKVLGLNTIKSLTALTRMTSKMASAAAAVKTDITVKSALIRFRKTPPTSVDLYSYIMRIYKHTQFIQQSENAVRMKKMTYQRPSRRDPDNPDRQGKTNKTAHKPDLHIYLDCSGSISERDYQDAMKACIKLAKKLNINFYFNSFSDKMSETAKLNLEGKTLKEIYKAFRNIPKVGGGTDYEQIWHYINKSAKREKRVSIIISDFEYTAPNHYVKHPSHLYYAPISASNWKILTSSAESFTKSMFGICPDIRKHILL